MALLFLRRLELQVMHPPDAGCMCRQKRRSYFLEIAVTYAVTQGVESPVMDLHDVQATYSPALESKSLPIKLQSNGNAFCVASSSREHTTVGQRGSRLQLHTVHVGKVARFLRLGVLPDLTSFRCLVARIVKDSFSWGAHKNETESGIIVVNTGKKTRRHRRRSAQALRADLRLRAGSAVALV